MAMKDAHWRDSARPARFFVVDYRAAFVLLLVIFYPRMWTLYSAGVCVVFLWMLERYGFTIVVFVRWFRSMLSGPYKIARPWWMKEQRNAWRK